MEIRFYFNLFGLQERIKGAWLGPKKAESREETAHVRAHVSVLVWFCPRARGGCSLFLPRPKLVSLFLPWWLHYRSAPDGHKRIPGGFPGFQACFCSPRALRQKQKIQNNKKNKLQLPPTPQKRCPPQVQDCKVSPKLWSHCGSKMSWPRSSESTTEKTKPL